MADAGLSVASGVIRTLCQIGAGYQVAVTPERLGGCAAPQAVGLVLLITSESDLQTYDFCRAIKSIRPTLPLIVIGPDVASTSLSSFPMSEKLVPFLMKQQHVTFAAGTMGQPLGGFNVLMVLISPNSTD